MVGGQCLDLEADKLKRPPTPDLDHVRRLQAMKTGALIKFACDAGALLGRATLAERTALAGYGETLGLAFQIADDLLDAEGDAASLGKATRKDAGKATFVAVAGLGSAKQRLRALVDEIRHHARGLGPERRGAAASRALYRQSHELGRFSREDRARRSGLWLCLGCAPGCWAGRTRAWTWAWTWA